MFRRSFVVSMTCVLLASCEGEGEDLETTSSKLISVKLDWEMPERMLPAYEWGRSLANSPLPPSQDFISPAKWKVKLDACGTQSSDGSAFVRWDWVVENPNGFDPFRESTDDCRTTIEVDEVNRYYPVKVTANSETGASATGSFVVPVRDVLVVSIGDSIASGEGNPDIPNLNGLQTEQWADRACHRSWWSGPALAARKLEKADKHSSVTFVSVACSGATIETDMIGPGKQVEQIRRLVHGRKSRQIDALLLQGGANDVAFSALVKACAAAPSCMNTPWAFATTSAIERLPDIYAKLKRAIDQELHVYKTFISEYHDPSDAANSAGSCDLIFEGALPGGFDGLIDRWPEAPWARSAVIMRLRDQVEAGARVNGWNFIGGITEAFRDHGYCSQDSWVVNHTQSVLGQRDERGTIHPNGQGHFVYQERLFEQALQPLLKLPMRPPPAP